MADTTGSVSPRRQDGADPALVANIRARMQRQAARAQAVADQKAADHRAMKLDAMRRALALMTSDERSALMAS